MSFTKPRLNFVRETFDPKNKRHQRELRYFLENRTWKTSCPFYLEFPYDNIPAMCQEKFALHALSK